MSKPEYMKQWRAANAAHIKEYRRKFYQKQVAAGTRKVERNDSRLRRTFGITQFGYDLLFKHQQGKCAVCNQPEVRVFRPRKDPSHSRPSLLAVDHNHRTGEVRQLLCARCNTILGHVNEDVQILQKLIAYLQRHGQ